MELEKVDTKKLDPIAQEINDLSQKLQAKFEELIRESKGQIFYDPIQYSVPHYFINREEGTQRYRVVPGASTALREHPAIVGWQLRQRDRNRVKSQEIAASNEKLLQERAQALAEQQQEGLQSKIDALVPELNFLKSEYQRYLGWGNLDLSPIEGTIAEKQAEIQKLREELGAISVA